MLMLLLVGYRCKGAAEGAVAGAVVVAKVSLLLPEEREAWVRSVHMLFLLSASIILAYASFNVWLGQMVPLLSMINVLSSLGWHPVPTAGRVIDAASDLNRAYGTRA